MQTVLAPGRGASEEMATGFPCGETEMSWIRQRGWLLYLQAL